MVRRAQLLLLSLGVVRRAQLLLLSLGVFANAYAHEASEQAANVGPDKAVTAFDEHDGFKLSEKAAKALGVDHQPAAASTGVLTLPRAALVAFLDETGVYRYRNGWYKLIDVSVVSRASDTVTVRAKEWLPTDHLVTRGVALLRVTDLDLGGGAHDDEHGEHDE